MTGSVRGFRGSPMERFMAKVTPEPNSGCWLWVGAMYVASGYGSFESRRAHRWSYQTFVGPIPDGLVIDHKCRVRSCVNPDHLRVVTNAENVLAGVGVTAANAKKTHCKRGHSFSGENLYRLKNRPGRRCIICEKEGDARRRIQRSEAQQGASK